MIYLHGGDVYRNPVKYDFSVNINPLGMPPGSLQAAREGLELCSRYPDWKGEELCRAIAAAEGVREEWILPGNGAAELIYALCAGVRNRKDSGCAGGKNPGPDAEPAPPGSGRAEVLSGLVTAPSFQEYEQAVRSAGGEVRYLYLREEEGFRLPGNFPETASPTVPAAASTEAAEALGKADLFFLCNPANPTGVVMCRSQLEQIAGQCEKTGTWFCLDECFLPFLEEEEKLTMKGLLAAYPHLIVLRAFTKIYGMPGLRLGYAMTANERLREDIRACIQPWNTSVPAQMAGIAALQDGGYLARTRELVAREKAWLLAELEEGLAEKIYESGANFIFFRARPDLQEKLLEQGVLIRSCAGYKGLGEGYFRIGVRTHRENEELIRIWQKLL